MSSGLSVYDGQLAYAGFVCLMRYVMDCHVPEECPSVELVYRCMIWINRINLVLSSVSIYLSICPRSGLQLHNLDQQDESCLIFCIYLSFYLS